MDLSTEIHHILRREQLAKIREFREALAYKTVEESHRMFYRWAVEGKLTQEQHSLLAIYIFCER